MFFNVINKKAPPAANFLATESAVISSLCWSGIYE
jgi:hypothetical protein